MRKNSDFAGMFCVSVGLLLMLAAQGAFAQEKIRTSTTLRSDHTRYTKPSDVITLSGEVVPKRQYLLQMSVLHPDGTYAYNGDLWTDDLGNYQLPVTVMDRGYIRAEVRFLGDSVYRQSGSEMIIPIAPEIGMAIVVAGGGADNQQFPIIEYLSDMVVQTFRRRGIPDEPTGDPQDDRNRIWYLHPHTSHDIDGVDGPDVDGVPTLANLESAIKTWSAGLIQTKDDSGNWWADGVLQTPLTIYLIDDFLLYDGSPSEFYINETETLIPATLDSWLDQLETDLKQQFIDAEVIPPSYMPVNVIVEGPSSGSFIAPLSQWGRVILTSTCCEDCSNYMTYGEGGISFTAYFLSRIATGHYIHPSFAYAQLNILTNPVLEGIEAYDPRIEATGNGISNEIADEIATASMSLEYRPIVNARPRMQNGLGQITLRDIPAAMLWFYVDDPENHLAAVEVMIIPPEESFEGTHVIELAENPSIDDRWEGIYEGFFGEGIYTVVYTATDEAGNVANPIVKHIIVEDTQPPEYVTNLHVTVASGDTVTLRWSTSESWDTQGYRIYVTPPGGAEFFWGDVGNVHEASVTGLDTPGIYSFRVTAYDRVPLESSGTSVAYEFQLVIEVINIDIYPNRTPNRVFLSRNYTLYVAVLGSASFDVTELDSSTVKFGKTGTEASPMRAPMIRDLNGDGRPDAMYGFRTFDCNFALSDTQGWLKGSTASGTPVEGSDPVLVLP